MGPRVHVATTLLGLRGFTVTYGSKVSLSVIPGILNPSSQVPTGLGWESSISGPSVEANVAVGLAPRQARAMAARPALNLLSAARRVTDWARLFVSSSNWLFMLFLSFLLDLARWGLGRNVGRAPPRSRGCSRVELTRPHRAAQLSAGFFALPGEAHAVVDALFAGRRLWISLRF